MTILTLPFLILSFAHTTFHDTNNCLGKDMSAAPAPTSAPSNSAGAAASAPTAGGAGSAAPQDKDKRNAVYRPTRGTSARMPGILYSRIDLL